MLNWKDASEEEHRLQIVLELIFSNHSRLLHTLFDLETPRLRKPSEVLLSELTGYSSGEKVMVQVALDLWDGSGNALFREVLHCLDPSKLEDIFIGLQYLKIISTVGAHRLSTIKIGPPSRPSRAHQSEQIF